MKVATINEIKKELKERDPAQILEFSLRLARFKKENKELLTFLLFEAEDLENYRKNVIQEMDGLFADMNTSQLYLAKKTLRKILRTVNKHIRFAGDKQSEVEWLLHFCRKIKASGIRIRKSTALTNMFQSQVKKIRTAIETMHEDLQYDYFRELDTVEDP